MPPPPPPRPPHSLHGLSAGSPILPGPYRVILGGLPFANNLAVYCASRVAVYVWPWSSSGLLAKHLVRYAAPYLFLMRGPGINGIIALVDVFDFEDH